MEEPDYAAMIEGMDGAIGRVLTALDSMGLTENTLLIFTSDNGSLFGNAPLRKNKGYLYEGGIRVPWIVRWPGIVEPGSTCSVPIISNDTYPTLLEVAGLPPEAEHIVDGTSLVPLLRDTGTFEQRALYFHYPNYAFHKNNRLGSAIRDGDYKLIKFYDDQSLELYNLATDLGEQRNLADEMPDRARAMNKQLDTWLAETHARMPVRVPQHGNAAE